MHALNGGGLHALEVREHRRTVTTAEVEHAREVARLMRDRMHDQHDRAFASGLVVAEEWNDAAIVARRVAQDAW